MQSVALTLLAGTFTLVRKPLALIRRLFAILGDAVTVIGNPVAFVGNALAPRLFELAPSNGMLALDYLSAAPIGVITGIGIFVTDHRATLTLLPSLWNQRAAAFDVHVGPKRNSTTSPFVSTAIRTEQL